jgi:rhamnosyl/mannosyltransferase
VPEIVVNGVTGISVPPKSSTLLEKAISGLLENPRKREMMGKEGRKRVEDFFTIEHFVKAMSTHYSELAYKHRDKMVS